MDFHQVKSSQPDSIDLVYLCNMKTGIEEWTGAVMKFIHWDTLRSQIATSKKIEMIISAVAKRDFMKTENVISNESWVLQ